MRTHRFEDPLVFADGGPRHRRSTAPVWTPQRPWMLCPPWTGPRLVPPPSAPPPRAGSLAHTPESTSSTLGWGRCTGLWCPQGSTGSWSRSLLDLEQAEGPVQLPGHLGKVGKQLLSEIGGGVHRTPAIRVWYHAKNMPLKGLTYELIANLLLSTAYLRGCTPSWSLVYTTGKILDFYLRRSLFYLFICILWQPQFPYTITFIL